jgi:hypothetical protein
MAIFPFKPVLYILNSIRNGPRRSQADVNDEMHFRRAGIGETGINAAGEQRAHEAFCTIHG